MTNRRLAEIADDPDIIPAVRQLAAELLDKRRWLRVVRGVLTVEQYNEAVDRFNALGPIRERSQS